MGHVENVFERWFRITQMKHNRILRAYREGNFPYGGYRFCRMWASKSRVWKNDVVVTRRWRLVCRILTFGNHWWKHYPGERRSVRCRICSRLSKGQWAKLQEMRK